MLQDINFYDLQEIIKYSYWILDQNLQKTASRKVVHKGSKFFGKKTLDPVTKSKDDKNVKTDKIPRQFEKILLP